MLGSLLVMAYPVNALLGTFSAFKVAMTTSKRNQSKQSGKPTASCTLKTKLAAPTRSPTFTAMSRRARLYLCVRRFFGDFSHAIRDASDGWRHRLASICKQISRISRASARA